MGTSGYGEYAAPPVTDNMVVLTLQPNEKECSVAVVSPVPIARCSASPRYLINRNGLSRLGPMKHHLDSNVTSQEFPVFGIADALPRNPES